MMPPLVSSSSCSFSAYNTAKAKHDYLVQTKEPIYGLRDEVLRNLSIRDELQLLETDRKAALLQQKEQILRQGGLKSLQTILLAKIVASYAYDEFLRRGVAALDTSNSALAQTASLLQLASQISSNNAALLIPPMQQFQLQIQALQSQLAGLPSLQPRLQDPQVRKEVQTIFTAWIVQNCQETLKAMQKVAQSVF